MSAATVPDAPSDEAPLPDASSQDARSPETPSHEAPSPETGSRETPSRGEARGAGEPAPSNEPRERSIYIVSPLYDWTWFLLPPIVALLIGAVLSGTWWTEDRFWLSGRRFTPSGLAIGTLTGAHLVAVAFRSHGNPRVFPRHRFRFLLLPLLTFTAMMTSLWAACFATVLVTFWDAYHSALQTFGLARIYDRNAGNDPRAGRWLDFGLNVLLYLGPIVAGATMLAHFKTFDVFEDVGAAALTAVPVHMAARHGTIARAVLALGAAYLIVYVLGYIKLRRRGYRFSLPKVFLLSTTGVVSIWAWGFNGWGQAFFIMNLFHAVQYLALVWWSEGGRLGRTLRMDRSRALRASFAFAFFGAVLAYGFWSELVPNDGRLRWSIVQTVALMHFYYDGFIWSVRKRDV